MLTALSSRKITLTTFLKSKKCFAKSLFCNREEGKVQTNQTFVHIILWSDEEG